MTAENRVDTIVAIASPAGRGAVGIVRVSGPETPRLADEVLGFLPAPRCARLADFRGALGESLDRGLALYFPAPHSFTGEHVLELHGHGGALVLDLVTQRLLALGCRLARPGEFSERAFLNGKMDIAQAEAVADLIDAGTAAAAKAAVRSLRGEFSARIHGLQAQLTELRAYVESDIDFPDEDIAFLSSPATAARMAAVFATLDGLQRAARQGTLLRDGLTVVIAGKPNAGKSSLLNRLVGDEVAIVTAHPGTTRDVLRQRVDIDGMPLVLVDTAGLREARDEAEREGVRRAHREIAEADRVLYVEDASAVERATGGRGSTPFELAELAELPRDVPVTRIFSKIDLTGEAPHAIEGAEPCLYLSARSGAGIELLRAHLKARAGYLDAPEGALSARRRHLDALRRAGAHVANAQGVLRAAEGIELFAEELRLAQRALGEITGEFTSEDLLGAIFASFCIGK